MRRLSKAVLDFLLWNCSGSLMRRFAQVEEASSSWGRIVNIYKSHTNPGCLIPLTILTSWTTLTVTTDPIATAALIAPRVLLILRPTSGGIVHDDFALSACFGTYSVGDYKVYPETFQLKSSIPPSCFPALVPPIASFLFGSCWMNLAFLATGTRLAIHQNLLCE